MIPNIDEGWGIKQMKNRCLILVSRIEKKTSKFVSDVCDVVIDNGVIPLVPIDATDIKSADINIPEMLMESDALIVIYRDDPDPNASESSGTEEEIWEVINDAESIGKRVAFIDSDREYEPSLDEYIKKALTYEM